MDKRVLKLVWQIFYQIHCTLTLQSSNISVLCSSRKFAYLPYSCLYYCHLDKVFDLLVTTF